MAGAQQFLFEPAPQLPGADRVSKYVFGAIRKSAPRLWDLEIEGRENIPTDGPAIIAPNHLSFCDSIFVPAALPRRVWAIGKGEYMDSWKTKHLFPAMGMIPIDRSGGDAAATTIGGASESGVRCCIISNTCPVRSELTPWFVTSAKPTLWHMSVNSAQKSALGPPASRAAPTSTTGIEVNATRQAYDLDPNAARSSTARSRPLTICIPQLLRTICGHLRIPASIPATPN